MGVTIGLENLLASVNLQSKIKGNVALLCHSASIDKNFQLSVYPLQKLLGKRLIKLMGPQHGFVTDVQDNMVETDDYFHPYFKLPVHSLYGKVRAPTAQMLENVNTVIVDLQDVGTRVYTYIHTLSLLMEECGKRDINVVVLDRPNPIDGEIIEGNLLEPKFQSFVGRFAIPMRHALTMGEMGLLCQKFFGVDCAYEVVPMLGWKRTMSWEDTNLPWVMPSPNLPTAIGCYPYVGTVLFEGVDISEGRGTTRSLEIVGHPKIEPFSWLEELTPKLQADGLEGFSLRPLVFNPTFQKFAGKSCGGFHIHPTNLKTFRPWQLGQWLLREFKLKLGPDFSWSKRPYEYQFEGYPIDFINGSDGPRLWVEKNGDIGELQNLEKKSLAPYLAQREKVLLYPS